MRRSRARGQEQSQALRKVFGDDWFATLIDVDGAPPCEPPDDCDVCVLFAGQRPEESREDWLARITESSLPAQRRAS